VSLVQRVSKWLDVNSTRSPLFAFNAANKNDPGLAGLLPDQGREA